MYTKNRLMIALDGASAVGKGSIGKLLSDRLELKYYQSSIVYRALAYQVNKLQLDTNDKRAIISLSENIESFKNDDIDLSDEIIGGIASQVAVIGEVRENLNLYLRQIVQNNYRLLMEGRDIGTKIAPNADLKIFLTARLEERAKRRYKQLIASGKDVILPEILGQLKTRDLRDITRLVDPLVPADDAKIIDTSDITPAEVIIQILKFLK